jgi:hypothetical protein
MKLAKRAPRGAAVMLVSLAAALAVAACGSSSNSATSTNASSTTSSKSASSARTAFEACLKQHGVTIPKRGSNGFPGGAAGGAAGGTPPTGTTGNFTPPNGGSGYGTPPGGGAPGGGFAAAGNSKFAKAMKACRSKLGKSAGGFGAAGGSRRGTPPSGSAGRAHFSDATLKSFVVCVRKNGYAAMPEANANGQFPKSVEKNAEFQKAAKSCYSILFHRPSGTTTTSSTTSTTSTT